jgi:hypothetical protein
MGCKAPFLANSPAIGKKSNAADRPSPPDHRPQGVMQRIPDTISAWPVQSAAVFALFGATSKISPLGEPSVAPNGRRCWRLLVLRLQWPGAWLGGQCRWRVWAWCLNSYGDGLWG